MTEPSKPAIHGCRKCRSYSTGLGRCTLGKCNPKTIKGAVDAMRFCGWDYVCTHSAVQAKALAIFRKEVNNGQ